MAARCVSWTRSRSWRSSRRGSDTPNDTCICTTNRHSRCLSRRQEAVELEVQQVPARLLAARSRPGSACVGTADGALFAAPRYLAEKRGAGGGAWAPEVCAACRRASVTSTSRPSLWYFPRWSRYRVTALCTMKMDGEVSASSCSSTLEPGCRLPSATCECVRVTRLSTPGGRARTGACCVPHAGPDRATGVRTCGRHTRRRRRRFCRARPSPAWQRRVGDAPPGGTHRAGRTQAARGHARVRGGVSRTPSARVAGTRVVRGLHTWPRAHRVHSAASLQQLSACR